MRKHITDNPNQVALDKALHHSRVQPWKTEKENPRNTMEKRSLRDENGGKSLIGSLISDEEYRPEMKNRSVKSLLGMFPDLSISKVNPDLLQEIEDIDHLWEVKDWERAFAQYARYYSLKCGWSGSTLHEKLLQIVNPEAKSGICSLVLKQRPEPQQKQEFWKLLQAWPEGTGYWMYPVPAAPGSKDRAAAAKAYESAQDLWADNPYGNLRKALLKFLLEESL